MIEVSNGVRTVLVPDATAQDILKETWLKADGWYIVKHVGKAPQEVIQFQQAKLKEPEDENGLFSLSVRELEGIIDTLTSEQLLKLTEDPRVSVKKLAEKQLKKLSDDSGK